MPACQALDVARSSFCLSFKNLSLRSAIASSGKITTVHSTHTRQTAAPILDVQDVRTRHKRARASRKKNLVSRWPPPGADTDTQTRRAKYYNEADACRYAALFGFVWLL
jgi:hypothetical protein